MHSSLEWWNPAPLNYIWSRYNAFKWEESAIHYLVFIHSCRYFSSEGNNVLLIKVFPDIVWNLKFFLNLTNDLSVKWMNASPQDHKKLQEKAGKIGAERRWKQKDVSFGFSIEAKWNENKQKAELKKEYETKFKKLYDIFASVGNMADGITNVTKGTFRSISPKGVPITFEVKPPNLELYGNWLLAKPEDNQQLLGTDVLIGLKAAPLIGLNITIDLLGAIIYGVTGALSGGTAAPGVMKLYNEIKGKLKQGIKFGTDEKGFNASVDIYMDLIISNTISFDTNFKFNTAGKKSGSDFNLKAESKLKVELKVGIKIKGEAAIVVIKVKAYFEASASASASVTFGHGIKYDDKGLYYRPTLGFDGMDAEYIIVLSGAIGAKYAKVETEREGKYVIAEGTYKGIIPPFDVIKSLEDLFNIDANIPLIKN
ncbi:hypothetical protein JJC03_03445 [Flavobacterium oreochromis]|uniref:hypothetical protein n=1 Tax=Flavobacterium oreochromis TaxID=2906078 RepID=UPI001CE6D933|nr:hypothetical protein [Flavobacterium oreochromis]QYS87037.1 hypothetical protein JJC03_03445 [Flavobacterium oreochromis]